MLQRYFRIVSPHEMMIILAAWRLLRKKSTNLTTFSRQGAKSAAKGNGKGKGKGKGLVYRTGFA